MVQVYAPVEAINFLNKLNILLNIALKKMKENFL